ncbi:unnamed protein product [Urochloa decumbens]|uniref:PGG domain-containing protein n=1 Tax=Urochloa decumbens TaxID=240449 RepID=A0ABC9BRQ1_9POAL
MSAPPSAAAPADLPGDSSEYKLRKQLLLLATLVLSVTYVAGLEPPGGVWKEDGAVAVAGGRVRAGAPILRSTHGPRYQAFYCFNSTALVASLVVIFLLLLKNPTRVQLAALRAVMVLDLLALMGAYLAGSCQDRPATVYATSLVLALSAYVGVHILQAAHYPVAAAAEHDEQDSASAAAVAATPGVFRAKERRKVVLLLATFAVAVTYVAGLSPPGGFWDSPPPARVVVGGGYRPGDSLVEAHHRGHYRMFFYCNATAFVASLFIVVLLLEKEDKPAARTARSVALYVFVLGALIGLVAAYTAGSCRDTECSVYVVSLFGVVLAFVFLVMGMVLMALKCFPATNGETSSNNGEATNSGDTVSITIAAEAAADTRANTIDQSTKKVKSLVLLLANLAATITYQAGLNPPGGFWPDGVKAGDAILLWRQPARYRAFFYCNTTAFVASVVAIVMVQSSRLVRSQTLLAVMVLDMFALAGAYAAGSCRDLGTTAAVAAAVLLYAVAQVLFFALCSPNGGAGGALPEKKHKHLLMLAILVAAITYQVGLAPPGGFWAGAGDDDLRHAGDAVLLDSYPRRFKAFFYCNTASFMASIALILLLVNPNLHRLAVRCYPLYACQVAGLLGLIGAYAAGSARSLPASISVLAGAVVAFAVLNIIPLFDPFKPEEAREEHGPRDEDETKYRDVVYAKRKYLMLLGILAASVTYQAGLAPPGGVWQDNGGGNGRRRREAGSPVLHDTDVRRYHMFFYSNSTSFVASVVVIALLLQQILRSHRPPRPDLLLVATNTAVVVDLLGLMAAYAAGSTREWESVIVLTVVVVLFMVVHAAVWLYRERRRCGGCGGGAHANQGRHIEMEEQVPNDQEIQDQPSSQGDEA